MLPLSNSKSQKVPKRSQAKVGLVPKPSLFWDLENPMFWARRAGLFTNNVGCFVCGEVSARIVLVIICLENQTIQATQRRGSAHNGEGKTSLANFRRTERLRKISVIHNSRYILHVRCTNVFYQQKPYYVHSMQANPQSFPSFGHDQCTQILLNSYQKTTAQAFH
jgi:hypothetical protein